MPIFNLDNPMVNSAMKGTPMDTRRTAVETLNEFRNAWAAGDAGRAAACFATDGEYRASVGPAPGSVACGRTAIATLIAEMLALDSSCATEISNVIIDQGHASWVWTYHRPKGPPAIGCDLFTFTEDGLIAIKDAYRKTLP